MRGEAEWIGGGRGQSRGGWDDDGNGKEGGRDRGFYVWHIGNLLCHHLMQGTTSGIASQIRNKLRYWAVGPARGSCYSQAALSSNGSKTLYSLNMHAHLLDLTAESMVKTLKLCVYLFEAARA